MKIDDLKQLAMNRIQHLTQLRATFAQLGDVEAIIRTEAEIAQTQATLDALNSL
jgi:hypothetical protein